MNYKISKYKIDGQETDWVMEGEVYSNLDNIDIKNDYFKIEIKDLLEHYIKRGSASKLRESYTKDIFPTLTISNFEEKEKFMPCPECGGEGCEDCNYTGHCFGPCEEGEDPQPIMTTETYSNVSEYNNSDDDALVRNGFQYWIDGGTLHFRMTARGKSSTNPNGYYDKLTKSDSERVGFTIAICTMRFDENNYINFRVNILPKIIQSDFYRVDLEDENAYPAGQIPTKPYKTCPVCSGTGYLLPGNQVECTHCDGEGQTYYQDRYGYPYYENSEKLKDTVFVNNTNSAYSAKYTTVWDKNDYSYKTTATTSRGWDTPIYEVLTSAIIPKYLKDDETEDVLNPGTSSQRNFDFKWDDNFVSSYLTDGDLTKHYKLDYEILNGGTPYSVTDYVYFTDENDPSKTIKDDLYVYLVTQTIDGISSTDITGKKVFLGLEV